MHHGVENLFTNLYALCEKSVEQIVRNIQDHFEKKNGYEILSF